MFLAITRVKDAQGDPTNEVSKAFIEVDAEQVAKNVEAGAEVEYYAIQLTPVSAVLHKASLKTGVRATAQAREIVEVEADGVVVGSFENDV